VKQYNIQPGLLGKEQTLIITEGYIRFEGNDPAGNTAQTLYKEDIADFKHGMNWIIWYRFTVGQHFVITLKDKDDREWRISFRNYFGTRKHLFNAYAAMVDDIWKYYYQDIVNTYIQKLNDNVALQLKGLKLTRKGIELGKEKPFLPWSNASIREYDSYFAIYDNDKPDLHTRISYNEYETESLWGIIMAMLPQKDQDRE
jgi:hypothetical protein